MPQLIAAMIALALAQALPPNAKPAQLVSKVTPTYTAEARDAHLVGTVRLRCVISAAGSVGKCQVVLGLGLGLDEAAIESAGKWRYAPGTLDGKPVAVYVTIDVNFTLTGRSPWRLSRVSFTTPAGAQRPEVTHTEFPSDQIKAHGIAEVTFTVDEQGHPGDFNINGADGLLEAGIVSAAKEWRFKPATQDGTPIPAKAIVDFFRQ